MDHCACEITPSVTQTPHFLGFLLDFFYFFWYHITNTTGPNTRLVDYSLAGSAQDHDTQLQLHLVVVADIKQRARRIEPFHPLSVLEVRSTTAWMCVHYHCASHRPQAHLCIGWFTENSILSMTMDMAAQTPHDPETPLRGRGRYPAHLGKAGEHRVPLHRRGTSRTYERLEDLLREAGYKETRVFTPEAERLEAEAEEREEREQARQPGRGVGAVVNFLSGLIPKNADQEPVGKALSLGRAVGKQLERVLASDESLFATPSPSPKLPARHRESPLAQSSLQSTSASSTTYSTSPLIASGELQYSAAQTALRHMASAPTIPRLSEADSHRRAEWHHQNKSEQPPLPPNWLQTVTKAIAGYGPGSGAHIGKPSSRPGRVHTRHKASDLAINRSQSQRPAFRTQPAARGGMAGIVDRTNKLTPPHFHSQRACTCTGTVTTTSVVCRSAPTSRSSSRVRHKGIDIRLPSLGVTSVEGEPWADHLPLPHGPRLSEEPPTDESSDEDIGELDLARLLVPAKRQKSIRSLRQHLHRANTSGTIVGDNQRLRGPARHNASSTNSAVNSIRGSISVDIDDSFEVGLQEDLERRRRGSVDENDEDIWSQDLPGMQKRPSSKRRGQLPWVPWNQGTL